MYWESRGLLCPGFSGRGTARTHPQINGRLLSTYRQDAGLVRGDLAGYVVEHLADAGVPLVVDETVFLAKVLHNHGVAGALDVGGHAAAHVTQADESYGFYINYTLLGSVSSLATPARSCFYEAGQL